ncbi:MAG: serine/threonine protein kinase [Myxococcales bacterium]|nr:serine/threonine protein kinase [Myxococcales bacterium]
MGGTTRDRESGPHLVEPRRVGPYEIVASLGRGGAGEAFLSLAEGPGGFRKLVVLKMLHPELEDELSAVEEFLDEARLSARLNHPNIVHTLEVGLHEQRHYLAMAYLEGQTLQHVLARANERDERVPVPVAARLVADLLDALAYAHSLADYDGRPLKIVHRDISPQNVFLCWDGSVKLLDFGIARATSRRANTDSGLIKGKFGYIAPEQASGEGVDHRADLWSAGVLLWEMLSGRHLFPARNDVTTLHALVAGELPELRAHAPDAPAPLVAVVERALQRDPDDRFPDAAAMRAPLESWLAELDPPMCREEVAAWLGDLLVGEREQQQALVRHWVGGARLRTTHTGSFHVSPRSESRSIPIDLPSDPPPPPRARTARGPLVLAALALLALVGVLFGVGNLPARPGTAGAPAPPDEADEKADEELSADPTTLTTGDDALGSERAGDDALGSERAGDDALGSERAGDDAEQVMGTHDSERAGDDAPGSERAGDVERVMGAYDPRRAAAVDTAGSQPVVALEAPAQRVGGSPHEATRAPVAPQDGRRHVAPTPVAAAPPTPSPANEEEVAAPLPTGWLTLDTTPWSEVVLDGRVLGNTPLVRVQLPSGEHELTLRNPEAGVERRYVVRIPAGQAVVRRVGLH